MSPPVWVFDLDNTLYPAASGLFQQVDRRIHRFMAERLGLAPDEIPGLRARYKRAYGVTLGGLMAHHGVDPREYLHYVHDVPLERHLGPDPALRAGLEALEGTKVVFTNGSVEHTLRVLGRLGVEPLFEAVFDIAFMDYVPKPRPHGYRKLLEALAVPAGRCILVDDLEENLDTGRDLGMVTVRVGPRGTRSRHRLVEHPRDLPGLFGPGVPPRPRCPRRSHDPLRSPVRPPGRPGHGVSAPGRAGGRGLPATHGRGRVPRVRGVRLGLPQRCDRGLAGGRPQRGAPAVRREGSRAVTDVTKLSISTPWIRLDQALKAADWVQTGGEAKIRIQAGEIRVNGQVETRRGRKLRPGDRVEGLGRAFEVTAEGLAS